MILLYRHVKQLIANQERKRNPSTIYIKEH